MSLFLLLISRGKGKGQEKMGAKKQCGKVTASVCTFCLFRVSLSKVCVDTAQMLLLLVLHQVDSVFFSNIYVVERLDLDSLLLGVDPCRCVLKNVTGDREWTSSSWCRGLPSAPILVYSETERTEPTSRHEVSLRFPLEPFFGQVVTQLWLMYQHKEVSRTLMAARQA